MVRNREGGWGVSIIYRKVACVREGKKSSTLDPQATATLGARALVNTKMHAVRTPRRQKTYANERLHMQSHSQLYRLTVTNTHTAKKKKQPHFSQMAGH